MLNTKCDWIYGNHSKLHIGSYEIIDFKDFKALLETISTVVLLYAGGVSLILPDVRFGTVSID